MERFRRGNPILSVAFVLGLCWPWGCADPEGVEEAGSHPPESSLLRVSLPSPFIQGYAQDIKGEVLQYHSPVPMPV